MDETSLFEDRSGLGQDIGTRLRHRSPRTVAAVVTFVGYIVMAVVLVSLGLIVTKLLVHGPVGAWDNSVNRWAVDHRGPTWNTLTDYASIMAGTGTVLIIAGVTAAILAIRRLWPELGFLACAFFIEFAVFLTTVTLIERPRPSVPKLDGVPSTSSFPSGHVAAAIALYIGLAILITSRTRNLALRIAVWVVAVTIVVSVGVSRVYRGLHHPIDVFAGVVLGTGAILFAILAIRAAVADSRLRAEGTTDAPAFAREMEIHA
jgi:membrane-associated phospholipid phosphatase